MQMIEMLLHIQKSVNIIGHQCDLSDVGHKRVLMGDKMSGLKFRSVFVLHTPIFSFTVISDLTCVCF